MEFLLDYGLFLAKSLTFLVLIGLLLGLMSALAMRQKSDEEGHIEVKGLNEQYKHWQDSLKHEMLSDDALKDLKKQEKKDKKKKEKDKDSKDRSRIFVLDFDGDIKASDVESLRHAITAVLGVASDNDEVLLRLESPGGMVHSYGLAASQLDRIRQKNIPLTIAIDRVAASGGYMMACIGDRILSAPFALIGSIGVVAQLPNFHRLLKKHDVDVELLTAGEYKRTLTMLGENTEEGRQKFQEELEQTHDLFKQFVKDHRPALDIESVATGEAWYGQVARDKGLVDEIMTSDDYLMQQSAEKDCFEVKFTYRKTLAERLGFGIEAALDRTLWRWLGRLRDGRNQIG